MKSNYKKIGDHIQLVDERNIGLKVKQLLGLSISKKFIPSVANIIGTDMENYKIIRKNQFACSTMQVRRDKKMPVALLQEVDEAIISQAYPVFEVKDETELLPEYLMMWFTRSEFDREACFHAVGGVRGSLEWEDFYDMQLPIPSPTKQIEIVKEYNIIQNRIALNQQLIQKLEETAQTIYKQWFVDFDFPNENGKPYKSNGGEMVFNEQLGIEIPMAWRIGCLDDVIDTIISHRGKSKSMMDLNDKGGQFIYPVITAMNVSDSKIVKNETIKYVNYDSYRDWMKTPLQSGDVIMTSEAPMGELFYIAKKSDYILSQRLYGLRVDKNKCRGVFLYFWFQTQTLKSDLEGRASGTTVLGIKLSELKKVIMLRPPLSQIKLFEIKTKVIMEFLEDKKRENEILKELKDFLLSKLTTIES